MKTPRLFIHAGLGLLVLIGSVSHGYAEIMVRISVKFILDTNGAYSTGGNIGTNAGFQVEIDRGNPILAATGRAYKMQVVEYIGIQPPAPAGSNANYWYNLDARINRGRIENAALAAPVTWRWNTTALNIYVNNSSSGSCSFVGDGVSISLGKTVSAGTVLHEVGHFFNLQHTHAGDDTGCTNVVVADGDSLAETIPDHNCLTLDGLSMANFGANYASLTAEQQAAVNTSWLNVMSYHNENTLLPAQMDLWGRHANAARLFVCSGRTWFVANDGADSRTGDNAGSPFATLQRGLSSVGGADDVVLLRVGTYTAPIGGQISTPCTVSATRGMVTVLSP
jgi:hypothetical protein